MKISKILFAIIALAVLIMQMALVAFAIVNGNREGIIVSGFMAFWFFVAMIVYGCLFLFRKDRRLDLSVVAALVLELIILFAPGFI